MSVTRLPPMDPRRTISGESHMSTFSSGETLYDVVGPSQFFTSAGQGDGDSKQFRWSEQSRIWLPSDQSKRQRTLVLCFDGTGDHFDSDNSNVVQLVAMLKKDDTSKQLVYYQPGIGTYTDSSFKTPFMSGLAGVLDEMLAWNIASHIKAGYAFLMENYTQGDKICIFGFSRGAYTARALAGMLQKIGLLPPHNSQQIPFAWDMYKREDEEGLQLSEMFKRTFCRDVAVDFLGVWDTVASVGLIPQYFPFITKNNGIKHLRHALALDERRIKFLPSYCVDSRSVKAKQNDHDSPFVSAQKKFEDMVNQQDEEEGRVTDVQEVWFAGVHTDVGGGSVKNDTSHALARIPLRWMVRECFKCSTDMIFDAVMLQQLGMSVHVNKDGIPVLGDQPNRLPPEQANQQKLLAQKSSLVWSIANALWSVVSYPVTYAKDIVHKSLSYTKHAHLESKRQTLPVRSRGAEYRLIPYTPVEAAQHEAEEERKDALSPLYDQLLANWVWHILEWIPVRVKKQKAIVHKMASENGYTWIWNRGKGRKIYKDEMKEGMKVHRSVKTRLEAGGIFDDVERLYWPKVRPNLPIRDASGVKKGRAPVRLEHHQWNVETSEHWKWVN